MCYLDASGFSYLQLIIFFLLKILKKYDVNHLALVCASLQVLHRLTLGPQQLMGGYSPMEVTSNNRISHVIISLIYISTCHCPHQLFRPIRTVCLGQQVTSWICVWAPRLLVSLQQLQHGYTCDSKRALLFFIVEWSCYTYTFKRAFSPIFFFFNCWVKLSLGRWKWDLVLLCIAILFTCHKYERVVL